MNLPADYFDRIAQRILAAHPAPDLRGISVLLPNMHAAQPLAQALVRNAAVPALLLPQMVTLDVWAQSVPLAAPIVTECQRSALLYQQLHKQQWFDNVDLWGVTQELLKLFDELTLALDALTSDAETFAAKVQQAYAARENTALQLEARLVFELWHAMQQGDELDRARARQQRLAVLVQQAARPLYVLRTSAWDAVEQRFLDAYAEQAHVTVFDLPEMAQQLPQRPPLFAATSLEQEARAAAMQVRCWLAEGKRNIAVVAQDRVTARRMRALLERAQILVTDETGWTLSTLSVSTVLERWLTALQSDFYHHDLLDLLKSPFIFADLAAGERKAAVYRLEQVLRKHGVVSGLPAFVALATAEPALQGLLRRLQEAAALLAQERRQTLAAWLEALQASLACLGVRQGLQQDEAGQQLLAALATWQKELAQDGGAYRFQEWRRWLAQQLDNETCRDHSIDSPVRFTHLAATRWRRFDAVLLLGCGADHLPSASDGGRWFNDAVRAALGLPTRSFHATRQRDDLHALLALNDIVLATWLQDKNGEPGLLSPYLQLLHDERAAPPEASALQALLDAEDGQRVALSPGRQPAPSVAADVVPEKISISAYNTLVSCPYRYYARTLLRLNELDEVQEAIEKRDYGERVHTILEQFHTRYPQVSGHDVDEMEAALRGISHDVFADLLAQDFSARAWLARWFKCVPAYLEWQGKNEGPGWRPAASEQDIEVQLEGVRLYGRIDRLDENGGECRVFDYKTQADQGLRNKLKEAGEDVQLASYALAAQASAADFISIEDGKVCSVAPPQDLDQLARQNAARLERVMAQLRDGVGLPANGIDAVCKHCEMRGLCRKGEWVKDAPQLPAEDGLGEQENG